MSLTGTFFKSAKAILVMTSALFFVACNYNQSKDSSGAIDITPPTANESPEPLVINYDMVFRKVIEPKCLHCHSHGSRTGVDLDTYDITIAQINNVRSEIVGRSMPKKPGPPLSDLEFKLIVDWIDAGAKL